MELIKRKIFLEESTDREYDSSNWGTLTATTFFVNIMLTQNIDDMGLFNDVDFIKEDKENGSVDYSALVSKLNNLGHTFPFMLGSSVQGLTNIYGTEKNTLRLPSSDESTYYAFGNLQITGFTESKLEDVRSYDVNNPFRVNFDTSKETYTNYNGLSIVGVDRIKQFSEPKIYVFNTLNDVNLGTNNQIYGLQYLEYSGMNRTVFIEGIRTTIPKTIVKYIGEGWNETNVSLSALTKEEYLFGIISRPEVESDVFIDRGTVSVMDLHLKLSEIDNIGELSKYGNGYYKLNKQ